MLIVPVTRRVSGVSDIESIRKRARRIIVYEHVQAFGEGDRYSIFLTNASEQLGRAPLGIDRDPSLQICNTFSYSGTILKPFLEDGKLNPNALVNFENFFYSVRLAKNKGRDQSPRIFTAVDGVIDSEYPQYARDELITLPLPEFYNDDHQVLMGDENGSTHYFSFDTPPIYFIRDLLDDTTTFHHIKLNHEIDRGGDITTPEQIIRESVDDKTILDGIRSFMTEVYEEFYRLGLYDLALIVDTDEGYNVTKMSTLHPFLHDRGKNLYYGLMFEIIETAYTTLLEATTWHSQKGYTVFLYFGQTEAKVRIKYKTRYYTRSDLESGRDSLDRETLGLGWV